MAPLRAGLGQVQPPAPNPHGCGGWIRHVKHHRVRHHIAVGTQVIDGGNADRGRSHLQRKFQLPRMLPIRHAQDEFPARAPGGVFGVECPDHQRTGRDFLFGLGPACGRVVPGPLTIHDPAQRFFVVEADHVVEDGLVGAGIRRSGVADEQLHARSQTAFGFFEITQREGAHMGNHRHAGDFHRQVQGGPFRRNGESADEDAGKACSDNNTKQHARSLPAPRQLRKSVVRAVFGGPSCAAPFLLACSRGTFSQRHPVMRAPSPTGCSGRLAGGCPDRVLEVSKPTRWPALRSHLFGHCVGILCHL